LQPLPVSVHPFTLARHKKYLTQKIEFNRDLLSREFGQSRSPANS
jgi:hypothetical protein